MWILTTVGITTRYHRKKDNSGMNKDIWDKVPRETKTIPVKTHKKSRQTFNQPHSLSQEPKRWIQYKKGMYQFHIVKKLRPLNSSKRTRESIIIKIPKFEFKVNATWLNI